MKNVVDQLAWTAVVLPVLFVALAYDQLPDVLPLTRWSEAPKAWPVVLRVPLINVFTLLALQTLVGALRRAPAELGGDRAGLPLLFAAAVKALIEGLELLTLPDRLSWAPYVLVAVVLVTGGTSAFYGRRFLRGEGRKALSFTPIEKVVAVAAVAGIVVMHSAGSLWATAH